MKFPTAILALAALSGSASAFQPPIASRARADSSLSMVLEKPKVKKLAKIETLKIDSDHLVHPLKEVRMLNLRSFFEVLHRSDEVILSPSYRYLKTK